MPHLSISELLATDDCRSLIYDLAAMERSGVELLSGLRLSREKALSSRAEGVRVSRARRLGPRDATDVISASASDLVVCTKHLSRLEPGPTPSFSSPGRRATTSPRPRNPSVPSWRPTQGDGLWPTASPS